MTYSRESLSEGSRSGAPRVALLALVLLAVVLRAVWAVWLQGAIQNEGAYYARLAENLASGRGYLGMRENGLQLIYPPFYPLMTAAVDLLVHQGEAAGRIVSILSGSLVVLPIWWMGERLHSRRVGLAAAAIVAVHPMLVGISAGVYSDALFLTLAVTGLAFAIGCLDGGSYRTAVYAGAAFTLAYLTRPEGLGFPVFLGGVIMLHGGSPFRARAKRVGLMLGTVAVLASPYLGFIWHETGQFRLETKSADNLAQAQAQAAGVPTGELFWGVDPDLTERGINLRSNLDVMKTTHAGSEGLLRNLIVGAEVNWPRVLRGLGEHGSTGGLPFVALAVLGLFAAPWSVRRLWHEAMLFASCAVFFVALTTLHVFWERYLIPFIPFMAVWVALGLVRVADWGAGTAAQMTRPIVARLVGIGASALAFMTFMALSLHAAPGILELSPGNGFRAGIGRDLASELPMRTRMMSMGTLIPFYSHAVQLPLPFADSETAIRYVALKSPDYLVLSPADPLPYARHWVDSGIPDPRAQYLRRWISGQDTVTLYRWRAKADRSPEPARGGAGVSKSGP